jgi:hypothetical protein
MRVLGEIANRQQMVTHALIAKDNVTAFCYNWQAWAQTLDQRNELWGRKMIADGGSAETLKLRHTENTTVPYGLQQLSYQLEHNSRFFRTGEGVDQTASQSTAAPNWPGYFSQPPTTAPTPTSLALGLQVGGGDNPTIVPIPFLPTPQLSPLQTLQVLGGAAQPAIPATSATNGAGGGGVQRVALDINVNQQQHQQPRFQQHQYNNQQLQQQQTWQQQLLYQGGKKYGKNKGGRGGGQGSGFYERRRGLGGGGRIRMCW